MFPPSDLQLEASPPLIAVVDDDGSVRRSLSRLIRAAGWSAETFSSAYEFMACELSPDAACVLLDIQMPGLSGTDLQEWMANKGISLPIIFLTAFGDVPTSVLAMKRGALDFLVKPVDDEVLLETISCAIARHASEKSRRGLRDAIMERHACLTAREREVMGKVIGGRLNKQIAADLGISLKTVKVHRARAMEKMGVRSVAALVQACNSAGIMQE
ncbi:MAG TPA: response regulator [Noviherbaspirillum sp.]|nr:response regulator [Noviherbaspirillum sp.]